MSNPGGRVNRQPLDERCARAIEASIGARCAGTTECLKRPARIAGTEQRRARIQRRTLHPFRPSEIDCRQRGLSGVAILERFEARALPGTRLGVPFMRRAVSRTPDSGFSNAGNTRLSCKRSRMRGLFRMQAHRAAVDARASTMPQRCAFEAFHGAFP
ncbi:MAG: hypothetical protein KF800_06690 [Lysobacter sp.]|nr:hypothetical protein [Lysobacter sp.]